MRESNFHTSILVVNILFNSLIIKAFEALSQCFNQNKKKLIGNYTSRTVSYLG